VLLPAPVFAHGLVGRADLPIPEELFAGAAALVLVLSFAALATLWSSPRLQEPRERRLFRLPVAVDVVLGLLGVVLFAAVVYAGLAGTSSQQDNLAPHAVYVGLWVGVPFVSLLLGDVFRLLSPWRALGRATGGLGARVAGEGALPEPLPYPERLGRWPAAAGILAFGICELAWAGGREPQTLAVLALVYLVISLVGMSLYGVEPWTRNADPLGAYFSLFARLAPLTRREGVLHARVPGTGAAGLDPVPGTAALLIVAIAITAFDGGSEGPLFNSVAPDLQGFFESLGASKGSALELAFGLGLVVTVLAVAAIYWGAIEGMGLRGLRRPHSRRGLGRALVHSLVPIAAAYVVAHYFSLLAYNGQDAWRLASDPLGDGSDLFGGAGSGINYSVVSATAIWYVQVGALVLGHVAALVLGHDRALALYEDPKEATRSQVVMLVLMVCFTCLGLWLLSAANG
jgi:hypothetical protein